MKYKPSEKHGDCRFEIWDKVHKVMTTCGVRTNIKAGHGYIYVEHAKSALINDKKADMVDSENRPVLSASEFLNICDGKKRIKDPQFSF